MRQPRMVPPSLWTPPPFRQYLLMRAQSVPEKRQVLRLMRQIVRHMAAVREQALAEGAAWQAYWKN